MSEVTPRTPEAHLPVPVEQSAWAAEALDKMQNAMSGRALSFTVNFADRYAKNGWAFDTIEVQKESLRGKGAKRWAGVFHAPIDHNPDIVESEV